MCATKHKFDCKMSFGKKDGSCPRCQELLQGAPARSGWQGQYFAKKARDDANRSRWIKEHNCKTSKCGPICTAFDW